jgi:hypothetical protein
MMAVNMSVPARIVKGVAAALIAGSRTPGFRDALAVCFWFTQDAVRFVPPSPPALVDRRRSAVSDVKTTAWWWAHVGRTAGDELFGDTARPHTARNARHAGGGVCLSAVVPSAASRTRRRRYA